MSDWKYSTSREILYAYINCSYVRQSSSGFGVRLLRPGKTSYLYGREYGKDWS